MGNLTYRGTLSITAGLTNTYEAVTPVIADGYMPQVKSALFVLRGTDTANSGKGIAFAINCDSTVTSGGSLSGITNKEKVVSGVANFTTNQLQMVFFDQLRVQPDPVAQETFVVQLVAPAAVAAVTELKLDYEIEFEPVKVSTALQSTLLARLN